MGGAIATLAVRDYLQRARYQDHIQGGSEHEMWVKANGSSTQFNRWHLTLMFVLAVVLVTFGSPRVGNAEFAHEIYKLYNVKRVAHLEDMVCCA